MTPPNPPGSRVIRWKLTEPVRLFAYPPLALLVLHGVLLAVDFGAPLYVLAMLGLVVIAVAGVESARAAVWSCRGMVTEVSRAAAIRDAGV